MSCHVRKEARLSGGVPIFKWVEHIQCFILDITSFRKAYQDLGSLEYVPHTRMKEGRRLRTI